MNSNDTPHIPVLLDAVLNGLQPKPGATLIDGTLGAGGHAAAWLDATAPDGRVLGFDRDPAAITLAEERLKPYGDRATILHASYEQMIKLAPDQGFGEVDGILLDLGFSSMQIDNPERGFSFMHDAPLDMRFDPTVGQTAADLLANTDEAGIADIIFRYGEDRYARKIARAIVAADPPTTTKQLADLIESCLPRSKERIHPATRTFQALRIAVNDELGAVERVLPESIDLLKIGGRLVVISFHSLEDRIVKHFIKSKMRDCVCSLKLPVCECNTVPTLSPVTRKPIMGSDAEIAENPRARSAKLRVAQRV